MNVIIVELSELKKYIDSNIQKEMIINVFAVMEEK